MTNIFLKSGKVILLLAMVLVSGLCYANDNDEQVPAKRIKAKPGHVKPTVNLPKRAAGDNPAIEYLLVGKSMFNEAGANVYPDGGYPVCYPVSFAFGDNTVAITGLFKNQTSLDGITLAPAVMKWDEATSTISGTSPNSFVSADEAISMGRDDDRIFCLQGGYPYGIGYWKSQKAVSMKVDNESNLITPATGIACVPYYYDEWDECYSKGSGYIDALFDVVFVKMQQGIALYPLQKEIDFGKSFVNDVSTSAVMIVNSGEEEADFVVSTTNPCFKALVQSASLMPGESVTIPVQFVPDAEGDITGQLIMETEETTVTVSLKGYGRNFPDYTRIVSQGAEMMTFGTSNDYPFLIDSEMTGMPVAVSTNRDQQHTQSWISVEVTIPEGKRGTLLWKGYFNPRWSLYDTFNVYDGETRIYTTPTDEQCKMEISDRIGLVPGTHKLKFEYKKGMQANPQNIVLGEDYTYLSDLRLELEEYRALAYEVSSGSYDFGRVFVDKEGTTADIHPDVLTIKNTGYSTLEILEMVPSEHFAADISPTSVQPEGLASVSLAVRKDIVGDYAETVVIKTNAGDIAISCRANAVMAPDYQQIVRQGEFSFAIGSNPFIVVDGAAVNDKENELEDAETISEFTASFSVPEGKYGLLTWKGHNDSGDGDMGMIMIDNNAYGMIEYTGDCDAGSYTASPYDCLLWPGEHVVSFGFLKTPGSAYHGSGTLTISDLSLELLDAIPDQIVWQEQPVDFGSLYPGHKNERAVKVWNCNEEKNLSLLDAKSDNPAFECRFNAKTNSQVPCYLGATVFVSYNPTAAGIHHGNITITTSFGDVTVPVTGVCMDNASVMFFDDFEDSVNEDGELKEWTYVDGNEDEKTWYASDGGAASSGTYSLCFNTNFIKKNADDYILSKDFIINADDAVLSYYRSYKKYGARQNYEVKIGSGGDTSSYETVYVDNGMNSYGNFDLIEIPLRGYNGQTVRICFANKTEVGTVNVLLIDDVKVAAGTLSGIETLSADSCCTGAEYYDMTGKRVANPGRGIYIVKKRNPDNTIRTYKAIVR